MQADFMSITSLTPGRLREAMQALGQPVFRAKQVFEWLHKKRVTDFGAMTNLPAGLRQALAARYVIDRPEVAQVQRSADGTLKLLMHLADGNCVETVVMRYHHGTSVCISCQVGCRMGCTFCASSKLGLVRNLTAGEMAGQVYAACEAAGERMGPGGPSTKGAEGPAQRMGPGGPSFAQRVGHLVLMGIGEPLDNFENVADFLEIIQSPDGYDMAGRNISLSTCGVVPGIEKLAGLGHALTLSLSLHAADDATRSRLMPVNRRWPLAQVMAACRRYQETTGRRVSYEYALARGENDGEGDARALAGLLAGTGGHLNLIPINPVAGSGLSAGPEAEIHAFATRLEALGVRTTVRRRLGADIDAACGQLRRRALEEGKQHRGK